mmetsp:Transcript_11729/g.21935  ORF Transcript_11729/g.21935 Transcript_11729/m.21935 type:complete len:207 (+) Transcript_11729:2478-3098(+)
MMRRISSAMVAMTRSVVLVSSSVFSSETMRYKSFSKSVSFLVSCKYSTNQAENDGCTHADATHCIANVCTRRPTVIASIPTISLPRHAISKTIFPPFAPFLKSSLVPLEISSKSVAWMYFKLSTTTLLSSLIFFNVIFEASLPPSISCRFIKADEIGEESSKFSSLSISAVLLFTCLKNVIASLLSGSKDRSSCKSDCALATCSIH